jgi:CRISPR/Cas system-associated exonuclease Cas4 (RecB family)
MNKDITFIEKSHTYVNKYNEILVSASTLVHKYTPEFDPDGSIIKRCAERDGIPISELRKKWDYERDSANERGTNFHKQAQHWVETGTILDADYKDIVKQLSEIPFQGKLMSETVLFSNDLGIAGTVDLIDIYRNNECDLKDFKTNKKLKKSAFWSKQGGYSMMLPPVKHLQNCNFITYSLQLEIYSILLEENGFWVNSKEILYIHPKKRAIEIHPILNLRKEALAIIKHYQLTHPKKEIYKEPN